MVWIDQGEEKVRFTFSSDNALPVGIATVGVKDGWSGRAIGGVTMTARNGATLSLGGEFGGLGAGYELWSAKANVTLPF